jgi:hypothetical protein
MPEMAGVESPSGGEKVVVDGELGTTASEVSR